MCMGLEGRKYAISSCNGAVLILLISLGQGDTKGGQTYRYLRKVGSAPFYFLFLPFMFHLSCCASNFIHCNCQRRRQFRFELSSN